VGAQPDRYCFLFLQTMNLSHRLLSSALLAGAVFSAALLPLATLGSKPVTIQLEEKPIFVGQLRELAAPYIALATGLSLGVGAVSFSLLSWQQTARKAADREAEIAALRQRLTEQEALVERLKFSDTKLQTSGLEQFLQPAPVATRDIAQPASLPAATVSSFAPEKGVLEGELLEATVDRPRPVAPAIPPDRMLVAPVPSPAQLTDSSGFSTAGLEFFLDEPTDSPAAASFTDSPLNVNSVSPPSPPVVPPPVTPPVTRITEPVKIQALTALPAAQSFSGFVRHSGRNTAEMASSPLATVAASAQLQELLSHLKQVTAQIERLQTVQNSALGNGNGNGNRS
jgi:hypothetical protein